MQALARQTDPHTSHIAAERIEQTSATDHRRMLLEAVLRHPGSTCGELATIVGLQSHQAGKRLPELREAGFVVNGPARKCSQNGTVMRTWFSATSKLVQKELW